MELFYDPSVAGALVKVAAKIFSHITRKDHTWPVAALQSLVVQLIDMLPEDKFSVSAERFCTDGQLAPSWESKGPVKAALGVLLPMSQIAISFAWLRLRCCADEPNTRDNKLNNDIEVVLSFVKTTASKAIQQITDSVYDVKLFIGMRCQAPIAMATAWLGAAREACAT